MAYLAVTRAYLPNFIMRLRQIYALLKVPYMPKICDCFIAFIIKL